MKLMVTFDDSAKEYILGLFGKTIDKQGFVVEKSKGRERVLTPRGEEIHISEFAGFRKGSAVPLKSDIVSLVEAAVAMQG